MSEELSRRDFLGAGAALAAGTLLWGCASERYGAVEKPTWLDQAPDGQPIRAGLIGCGGRGTGAAGDFLSSGTGLEIVALGDVFQDRIEGCIARLEERGTPVVAPKEKQFVGFDAFQKVIESGVDLIILATPPHFRPEHFRAAIEARKHVFMEKPLAVDPVGVRSILATIKRAETLGLSVGTGTQRHHQHDYVECYEHIRAGAIGDIVSANCYWDQGQLWYRKRQADWSDMEYMIRDWVNWTWLSGDHIVEQHIHNIDVINWFTGSRPEKAVGYGGRHRRVTGDQYDYFAVDFTYENGIHVSSMCRQIDGTHNNVSEWIVGTRGVSNCKDIIKKHDGSTIWKYESSAKRDPADATEATSRYDGDTSPYVQEHIDLVAAIRAGQTVIEAELTAVSTLSAIMGRISAYTGKEVTWEEMMSSELTLGPTEYRMGSSALVRNDGVAPVPGEVKSS